MENNSLKKIERILFIIFLILGVVVVIGVILLIRSGDDKARNEIEKQEDSAQEDSYNWEDGLSDSTVWLPQNCNLYNKIIDFTFSDIKGVTHRISDFEGKPTVVVFWASWCSDCEKQMPQMKEYIELSKKYGDVTFLFINKTDGEKETKEAASNYMKQLGIEKGLYFDEGLHAYKQLGIHNIPTTFFLDANGVITAWTPKQITKASAFQALLTKAFDGGSAATFEFVTSKLLDQEGGLHSIYEKEEDKTFSSQVLSESQGIMLEYAVRSNHKEVFERILQYTKKNLWKDGLTAWQVINEEASNVNALIDDFRIYDAIDQAQSQWGGYEEEVAYLQERLLKFGIHKGRYIDFYDADSKAYAQRFTLCYADFLTMEKLAKDSENAKSAYEASKELVIKGQISEQFPLYYSWYNYKEKRYEKDDLNTAEAMMTLLHLSEADLLPDNTLKWLKKEMSSGGVKARYSVKGEVVNSYNYDSTAVYALIAMIGVQEQDQELINQAVRKMEKMRIDDTSYEYNGAFGQEDGSGITSFDQVIPLLAYQKLFGK